MKNYSFALLQARSFPTITEVENPYIYGRVGVVLNVSLEEHSETLKQAFEKRGIKCFHFPLVETGGNMGLDNILKAIRVLEEANSAGLPAVIHCNWGNNRSRVVAEAFHFRKMGFHLEDGYKGSFNHLAFNCKSGHLPSLPEMEGFIQTMMHQKEQQGTY